MIINSFYFILPFIITFLLVPIFKKTANEKNIFDRTDIHKKKNKKIPRIGGGAIIISFLFSLLIFNYHSSFINKEIDLNLIQIIFFGSLSFYLIGLIDDLFNISPFKRLVFQFLVSFPIWQMGFQILTPNIFIGEFLQSNIILQNLLSLIITSLWIVAVVNSFNWLDGLDGLAAGCSIIFLFSFLIIGFKNLNYQLIFLSLSLLGGIFAFLKYNFYPSQILMGDGGSYFLGFNMAVLSLISANISKINFSLSEINFKSLFFAALLISIPLIDMVRVIFLRIFKRKSPFFPDRQHLHYQLIDLGIKELNVVKIMYLMSFLIGQLTLLIFI